MFYVYEWYNKDTGEIFYVGKGCGKRYLQTTKRNKYFTEYIKIHDCAVRIVKQFDDENDAFEYEHDRICELKKSHQCKCNLDNGGNGGLKFIWTDEMRKYKSIHNPMKNGIQRKRMSQYNPMKNKNISEKVNSKKKRKVIVKGIYFDSVKSAAQHFNRYPTQITLWCKRGYDTEGEPCRYADEPQKNISNRKITCSKKVIIDGKTFNSVKEGAEYIGVWSETLIRAIKQNRPCKGHICEYDNQQPSRRKSGNSTTEGSTTNR